MLRQILQAQPNHAEALHELGMIYHRAGRPSQAMELLARAVEAAPQVLSYRFNLALMLLSTGNRDQSFSHFQLVADLATKARDAKMLDTIGAALRQAGHLTAACEAYARALEIEPGFAPARNQLGIALMEQGKLDEALAAFHAAIQANPACFEAMSNLLLCLNYHDRYSPEEIFAEHQRVGNLLAAAGPRFPARKHAPASDGRIRIGYLSPDFSQHSVSFFAIPFLAEHDRSRISVTCYSDVRSPDLMTQHIQRAVEHWRPIVGWSDDRVAEAIAADGIDILIDLTGHTTNNRMALLARRVAPIQVTYLGYPNTSGLAEVDYRITDSIADPPGMTESQYTEEWSACRARSSVTSRRPVFRNSRQRPPSHRAQLPSPC